MRLSALLAVPLVAGLSLNPTPEDAGIAWQPTLQAAFDAAQESETVVFLAVNMDGERANDEAANRLYRDKEILALAAETVNVVASRFEHGGSACKRFGTITCADHQDVDKKARAQVLKPGMDGEVIAPQHVWLAADGTVLLSVPYQVSKQELTWCFITALNQVADPESQRKMPSSARAPRRLVMDGVTDGGADGIRPLSDEEVEKTVERLRSGVETQERVRLIYSLIATDHPDAVEAVAKELSGANIRGGGGRRGGMENFMAQLNERKRGLLGRIGTFSPPAYWEAVVTQIEDEDDALRLAAAVALEQLAAKDSLKTVKARLKKEESLIVKAALLRAQGTAGAGDSSAKSNLLSTAKKKKEDEILRLNALYALGAHAKDKGVRKHLDAVVAEGSAKERQALVLGLAFARSEAVAEALFPLLGDQGEALDPATRAALEAAQAVLEGGNLSGLAGLVEEILGDTVRRERFFGSAQG
jgi:hypothetical protein